MTYKNLYIDFKNLFLNYKEYFLENEKENNLDKEDGIHILYGLIIVPFIIYLVNKNNTDKLKICFQYFEKMATSDNHLISEVLEFTILENILDFDKDVINLFKQYMGENITISFNKIQNYST